MEIKSLEDQRIPMVELRGHREHHLVIVDGYGLTVETVARYKTATAASRALTAYVRAHT